MIETFEKIGIISKHNIAEKKEYVENLIEFLIKKDKEVYIDGNIADALKGHHILRKVAKTVVRKDHMLRRPDMAIALGGDGTILKIARHMVRNGCPVLSVNLGNLGFHTEVKPSELEKKLELIFKDEYDIDERSLLRITAYRKGKKCFTTTALNEAVINQGGFARLINLRVEVDNAQAAEYKSDGLIVATPSGSTAHSLSAGGPIVHPKIPAFVLTPICPIKLSFRPIVIPNDRKIGIHLETSWRHEKKPIVLTIDGQVTHNLHLGDTVRIRKSSRTLKLIRMQRKKYFRMLREKLQWGT